LDGRPLGRQGFTLIELLLAVGLSALMVGVVMGTYLGIRNGVAESLVYHEAEVEGVLMSRRILLDIESAYLGNPASQERFYFEGMATKIPWQTTRLSFVTTAVSEDAETLKGIADMGRVTYRLVPEGNGGETYELYRDVAPLGSRYPVKKELLSDRVREFRVVYEDRNHHFSREWNSRGAQWKDRLPTLVRIELTVEDEKGKRHTFRGQAHPEQDWME